MTEHRLHAESALRAARIADDLQPAEVDRLIATAQVHALLAVAWQVERLDDALRGRADLDPPRANPAWATEEFRVVCTGPHGNVFESPWSTTVDAAWAHVTPDHYHANRDDYRLERRTP